MPASLIIHNASVLTQDPKRPREEALAISGNRITAVGKSRDILKLKARGTKIIDANGATVIPGFVESHVHLFAGASEISNIDFSGVRGLAAIKAKFDMHANEWPVGDLIIGNQMDYAVMGVNEPLTRHHLDSVAGDRPILVFAADHHTGWANTAALKLGGILEGRTLGPGNEIVMGADGLAAGELRESQAFDPVLSQSKSAARARLGLATGGEPDPYPGATDFEADLNLMRKGLAHAAKHGITSMHNMDGNLYQLELLSELERRGELTARVRVPFHYKPFMPLAALERASAMAARWQGPMLTSSCVKIFIDGVLDSWTAVMKEPYADRPDWTSDPLLSQEHFNAVATEADRRGLQVQVHAIGDGAVNMVLNGYEAARKKNGARDSRHRIEHIEVVLPSDIPRFKKLGVVASMQPAHPPGAHDFPLEPTIHRMGKAKWKYSYAWRTLKKAGATIAFGSDWPVSDISVLRSLQAAVTRKPWGPEDVDQSMKLSEAIELYTVAGTYTEFAEKERGMLRKGMLADVAILDGDIEKTSPDAIGKMTVRATICDGRIVYGH
jgi:predicted amidohydrolase YtcJ